MQIMLYIQMPYSQVVPIELCLIKIEEKKTVQRKHELMMKLSPKRPNRKVFGYIVSRHKCNGALNN